MPQSVKRKYEAMFLVDSAVATAEWDSIVDAINTIMKRGDADIISLNKWDERRLCHEVKKRKRGTYVLCYFNALPSAIKGIERDVQISEVLLRVLILSTKNIPEEIINKPTPAMKAARREAAARETAESATAVEEEADVSEDAVKEQGEDVVASEAGSDDTSAVEDAADTVND